MTRHETGAQRYRRLKADKFRGAQLAPRVIAPQRCVCGQSKIMHRFDELTLTLVCLAYGCGCTEYREATA